MRPIKRVFGLSVALIFSSFSLIAGVGIADAVFGQTTRVSVSSTGDPAVTGDPANAHVANNAVLSANGRYVVFESRATNLIPGVVVTGATSQVYRYDRRTHVTDLVSRAKTAASVITPGNSVSRDPSVSADGRYVVFSSFATDLVDVADTNNGSDVFVRDMQSGTTALVSSTTTAGVETVGNASSGLNGNAGAHEISDDGRYVVFTSFATNLVDDKTNSVQQIYRKDLTTNTIERASVGALDGLAGNFASQAPAISGNGLVVAFSSAATNLVPPANTTQVYVRDFPSGTTTLESSGAATVGLPSTLPALSFDGRYVVFVTAAHLDPLDADNGNPDVFLRDRAPGGTTVAASLSGNAAGGVPSGGPSISADGRWVGFNSLDDQIVPGDVGGKTDVFLYDRDTKAVLIVSRNDADAQADQPSFGPSVSCDGHNVLFNSNATNLFPSANAFNQLYVRDVTTNGAPVLPAFAKDMTLAEGKALSLSGDFTDNDSSMWTATVDWGAGAGKQPLALVNHTISLDHTYAPGTYDLTVEVTDCSGATGALQIHLVVGAQNQAPVLPTFATNITLAEGTPLKLSGDFTDNDSTSWTATVDWGSGAGKQPLALVNKTISLDHLYAPGAYDLKVEVTDNAGATSSLMIHVVVNNVAPTVVLPPTANLPFVTMTLNAKGTFTDPGSNETYSATVDYGDGTPPQALALGPSDAAPVAGGSFTLSHTYATAKSYTVAVTVSDGNGGPTTSTMLVNVGAYTYDFGSTVFSVGRNLPVKFTVLGPDGSFVLDPSIRVDVVDAAGTVVAGPYFFGDQPSRSVMASGDSYHVNVDTRALAPGAYSLRVQFSSATLRGEFRLDTTSTAGRTPTTATRLRTAR